MSSIVSLVIYLSALDVSDPNLAALRRSAQEVLGNQAEITFRTRNGEISDSNFASATAQADAIAEVVWAKQDHDRVLVRCYVPELHRLIKREIVFDRAAEPKERERLLGFVIASMLPSDAERGSPTPAEDGEPGSTPAVVSQSPALSMRADLPARERFVGLAEVVGLGATGIGGSASSVGAALAGRWLFARALSLRLSAGIRRGEIPEASAISEVEFIGLGLALNSAITSTSRFTLGGHVDGLLLRHEVDHLSSDDPVTDQKSRLMPGADALFEACFQLSASASLVAGIGAEAAFGRTSIFVKGNEVTNIPPLRAVLELGIQAKF
jgi:hypothetical protein